jgi:class 3 adenylate cyclase
LSPLRRQSTPQSASPSAIFPLDNVAGTVLTGIEDDLSSLEWFDQTSNRSLYVWPRDATTVNSTHNSSTSGRAIGVVHSLQFKFAQRTWRLDVCFFDEATHVDHQVVVPVVFVAVAVGVAVVVAMVLCIRSASAHENGQRQLLSMVFPVHIASALIDRLRVRDGRVTVDSGGGSISQYHEFVTLIFIDICDFTTISSYLEPHMLVRFVDEFVCVIDTLLARYPRLLKIKTIGDAYFVAAGLGDGDEKSADGLPYHVLCLRDALDFCARVQREVQSRHRFFVRPKVEVRQSDARRGSMLARSRGSLEEARSHRAFDAAYDQSTGEIAVRVRIGVHIGAVVAGVCGRERPVYDVWGDTCNVAARIESTAANGTIQLSSQVRELLCQHRLNERFRLRKRRRERVLKGIGSMATYTLLRDLEQSDYSEAEDESSAARHSSDQHSHTPSRRLSDGNSYSLAPIKEEDTDTVVNMNNDEVGVGNSNSNR